MTEELRNKLAKVYALVNNGATDGEKAAAKKALDRMLDKYGVNEEMLKEIDLKKYAFTYSTNLDLELLNILCRLLSPDAFAYAYRRRWDENNNKVKQVITKLSYTDWIELTCSYEYFRRHMKKEFKRVAIPEIKKLKNPATKAKRRKFIEDAFVNSYLIASKLYEPKMLCDANYKGQQLKDARKLVPVEGGVYHKQVASSHILTNQL